MILTREDIDKNRWARHLLPDPGPEVVGHLLDTIDARDAEITALKEKLSVSCAGDLACGGICPLCAPFREEEINALKAKIERLVAAGDDLYHDFNKKKAQAAWTAAKEDTSGTAPRSR